MSEFTIGKLAKLSLVSVETVRFYERMGLLQRPQKKKAGFRQYSENDASRIRFIKRAQELGYTLKEIKELLEFETGRLVTCGDYSIRIERKLKEIDEKMRDLKSIKTRLLEILSLCVNNPHDATCRLSVCFENGCDIESQLSKKVKES